eukprot:7379380-Prymnesium_polylepis.1
MPPPPPVTTVKVRRLKGSVQAEDAVEAAMGCEIAQTWLREGEPPVFVAPGWEGYDAEDRGVHQRYRCVTYRSARCSKGALPDEGLLRQVRVRRMHARQPMRVRRHPDAVAVDNPPPARTQRFIATCPRGTSGVGLGVSRRRVQSLWRRFRALTVGRLRRLGVLVQCVL